MSATLLYEVHLHLTSNETHSHPSKAQSTSSTVTSVSSETVECGCCFSDIGFCEAATCAEGCLFCKLCLQRSVKEVVFGQAPIQLFRPKKAQDVADCGAGMGIRCLSIEGCQAAFSDVELQRCLPEELYHSLEHRIAQEALRMLQMSPRAPGEGKRRMRVIQCPFCSYAEVQNLPSLACLFELKSLPNIPSCISAFVVVASLSFIWILASLFLVDLLNATPPSSQCPKSTSARSDRQPVYLPVDPARGWQEISERLRNTLDRISTMRNGAVFHCRNVPDPKIRNPTHFASPSQLYDRLPPSPLSTHRGLANHSGKCGRSSCLLCGKLYYAGHACTDSLDSLRLAMEAAETNAVTRQCPECRLSFIKLDGCNKVVCRCGNYLNHALSSIG